MLACYTHFVYKTHIFSSNIFLTLTLLGMWLVQQSITAELWSKRKERRKNTKRVQRQRKYGSIQPMAQYLHKPEDQQSAEIFSCCTRLSWKKSGLKRSHPLKCSLQDWSNSHHKNTVAFLSAMASCHFQSRAWIVVCGRKSKMGKCLQEPWGNRVIKNSSVNSCSDSKAGGKVFGPK